MKAILFLSVIALSAAPAVPIAKITTLRGKTFRQCDIVTVHPDGVSFTHINGAAKVLFTDLSKEWRTRLGYDSQKAAAYQKELTDKRLLMAVSKMRREQELNKAMAETAQAARYRQLGLTAQADAARRQQAANSSSQPIFPVLPALGAVYDSRSVEQSYDRPSFSTQWRGGIYGNYPAYTGMGFQFGGSYGGFTGFGFGATYYPAIPCSPPPAAVVTPHVSRHTIITR